MVFSLFSSPLSKIEFYYGVLIRLRRTIHPKTTLFIIENAKIKMQNYNVKMQNEEDFQVYDSRKL
ncbi:MAG: hypothetical protein A3H57_00720 [Candidatus Taylorbacteria bacterium RIFCSPLOWO2_02_FULL_43_11]|uniref:Uncharacterized protein n=1 Tax=Candidatus Taylorbacteria bacterium RIFCSPHIGHO2_02_FULL_43_32b TaxID=1802306 RepID=A0A1G2MHW5_9BACT|nr:MAG: hypothetical protein A2743_01625 [Candidatus Taylorbacteria bacterium RIFCSPHIGHO2_01_FULL_43_47]OHA23443.1 MAG: hypothetical protein A3C72_03715 [Candidatus Taylorbacteria bacterium RIFCSPHIGHO2_02_FULL_43_32b]OHA30459.1 MAG: hypothetical protein A3B08_02730 [Candidatus Taylorbacteria bacterium RIFCSPLOWO2_01_FULL_43_44]OHA37000.1 MAG: hypothetical protein A3H57_00720 [Candidatus Taylorbacteria bacterium RIFCSPLOWO2_02_FULL_43_11]